MRYSRFSASFALPSVRKVWGRFAPKRSANAQTNNEAGMVIIAVVVALLFFSQVALAKTVDYYFCDVITNVSLLRTMDEVDSLISSTDADSLNFWINSPGGYVSSSFAMYDYLIKLRKSGIKVDTYATGMCASGATIVLQAGETRYVAPFCLFMIHRSHVSTGYWWKDFIYNNLPRESSNYVDNNMIDLYIARTKLSRDHLEKMMEKDCWLYGVEVKELNFADKVFIGL
jgi:ATP-dependent protease ClpP protease subunit